MNQAPLPRPAAVDRRRERTALTLLLAAAFAAAFWHPDSYFRDSPSMIAFLEGGDASTPASTFRWTWDSAPSMYRVLFHGLVDAVAQLSRHFDPLEGGDTHYHRAIALVSAAAFAAAGLALDHLLVRMGRDRWDRAVAALCWLAFPAVHYAYLYPTDTKGDFFGYAIFFMGLSRIVDGRTRGMLLWCVLGAATRETLLLLPGLFFLIRSAPLSYRLLCLACAVMLQIGIRTFMGIEPYGVLGQGLCYNLENPGTALIGSWLILGFAWIPLLSGLDLSGRLRPRTWMIDGDPLDERSFDRLFLPAAAVLLSAHFVLGRMNEIRISFLLAPWAILALLRVFRGVPRDELIRVRQLLAPAAVLLLCALPELLRLGTALREATAPFLSHYANRSWWIAIYLQLALTAWVLRLMILARTPLAARPTESEDAET